MEGMPDFMVKCNHQKKLIPVYLILFLLGCASSNLATRKPVAIEVKHQNLLLHPIRGVEKLESNEYWPDSVWQGKFLIENIQQVWKNLLGEFRRCEKYGLYTMVDSTASSTVDIIPEIINSQIRNDTLFISFEIRTNYKSSKRSSTMTIDAYGLFKHETEERITVKTLVSAFADYRRRFPYGKVVSVYYTGKAEK